MTDFLLVSERWRAQHPGASAGVLGISGLEGAQRGPALDSATADLENELQARFDDRAQIRSLPIARAYTAYYKRFKKTYQVLQQVESVALKNRAIPRISPLVQAMFTAELKNLILSAGHDRDALRGPVRLESALGEETFLRMGGKEQGIKAGDMFMADDQGVISDVIYGPDERTKLTPAAGRVLFAAYGPPGVAAGDIESHLGDIEHYCRLAAPGSKTDFLEVHRA